VQFWAGEKSFLTAAFWVMLRQKQFENVNVRTNADLTLLRRDGNIFVSIEEWLALPFRTDPGANQTAA
jgi:hypothetical protein